MTRGLSKICRIRGFYFKHDKYVIMREMGLEGAITFQLNQCATKVNPLYCASQLVCTFSSSANPPRRAGRVATQSPCLGRYLLSQRIGVPTPPRFLINRAWRYTRANCPLQMALMHDQLKPDCLTRRNIDILRLTADALYGIPASGHVENGVSKIIR